MHYEKFADGTVKCIEDEIPFDIPDSWAWTRLSSIASFSGGKTPSTSNKSYWGNDILWVTSKDMKSKYINTSLLKLSCEGAKQMELYAPKTLLLVVRSGILRHTIPTAILIEEATVNQDIKAISLFNPNLVEYIYICIKGMEPLLLSLYVKSGVTVENINFDKFQNALLPIPPLKEIEKILVSARNAEDCVDKIEQCQSILQDDIKFIKSRILDLAICGKLVPQDPNDEPASVLLERIKAEKEELIKQGKIKREKTESAIFKGEDNSYYDDIPENWAECSILQIAEVELGKTLDAEKNKGDYHPYLRSVNIRWNGIDLNGIKEMRFEKDELERYSIKRGDLLICEGGDVGRCCVWNLDNLIFYQNALHRVRFYGNCNPQYFAYILICLESIGYLKRISNGVTIKHLTKNGLSSIPFLLPPLAEQNRIVETIEKYFAYLDNIAQALA